MAVLIVDGLHYLNYTAAKFNHDVIQLPFWALAGFAFHRALRGGGLGHWLLLGVAIGMSLWAKYFVVVLAVPLALFLLIDRDARKSLATPGPYVAVAAALVMMAPHLVWLVQNDFLPFAYAEHRAVPSRGLIDHVWHPLQFARRPVVLPDPVAADRAAAVLSAPSASETPVALAADAFDRRIVTLARLRADGDGAGAVRRSAAAAPWRCGAIRSGCSSGVWIVLIARRALDAMRLGRVVAHLGDRVRRSGARLHRQLRACCRTTITATARCSFRAAISAANCRSAIAPSPESRSSM